MISQPIAVTTPLALDDASARTATQGGQSFAQVMSRAVDSVAAATHSADGRAAALAAGSGTIADAAIARAKADIGLEICAVTAARLSASINTLLQTQV